jgi:hypothetical protein
MGAPDSPHREGDSLVKRNTVMYGDPLATPQSETLL